MVRPGISVYPGHSTAKRDQAYIRKAGNLGYKRIFTCLLGVGDKNRGQIVGEFYPLADTAYECGVEIIPDVSPAVFFKVEISYEDLSIFQDMYVDRIRLDEGFDDVKESLVIHNPRGLKIRLNVSTQLVYVESITDHHPDRSKLVIRRNFYPQQYSELSLEHFNKCNEKMKSMYLSVAAFIPSNNEGIYGPWSVNEGFCTLKVHHGLSIGFQARHLFATGMVDDVLIANVYVLVEGLETCVAVNPSILTFRLALEKELTRTEREILDYEPKRVIHGDMSEYVIRSTWPGVTFADEPTPAANTRDLRRGDVVILNDGYLKCKGELHIVLKDMPNDGHKGVIGHLPRYEHVLLNCVESWKMPALCKA